MKEDLYDLVQLSLDEDEKTSKLKSEMDKITFHSDVTVTKSPSDFLAFVCCVSRVCI